MSKNLKDITILHTNDIHGKFAGETDENGKLCHSLTQLAGYVKKRKTENPDTVFCIAGDVFQGSLLDSDFQGMSTLDMLNLIDIDVMAIGNHELDYGISHMMFAARYADFPILNANFRIRKNERTLFKPYNRISVGGLNVLFIGLITEDIANQTNAEGLLGTYVTVLDPVDEVRRVVEYVREKHGDPDLTVLMTHIGYEEDIELAKRLDPSLGVKIIIGAHSHTLLEKPGIVNDILILQAGTGNTHIGDLRLSIDTDLKEISDWSYSLVPVDEEHCPQDKYVKAMVNSYQMDIDERYGTVITRFKRDLDNYGRGNTTELGQVFVDAFTDALDVDVMMIASPSIRCYKMDMTVTLQDLREAYPYDGKIYKVKVSGKQLRNMISHMLRDEVLDDWEDAFFHTSRALHIEYTKSTGELELSFKGQPVANDQLFDVGIQEFYYINSEDVFGQTNDELAKAGGLRTISEDAFGVLKEYLQEHKGMGGRVDKRIIII
ncbi:MAG: bifunctional metallophosphatase/5'-nucleotidase [Mogibacterium sp.]|nr:bifunctional metallophosphatase/5'-nucleotidase [Mogibacterium sp.]MBQ6501174.1 bifunctional metallophosphatase/5'-nucleotidase [Mogibacterium sp.]